MDKYAVFHIEGGCGKNIIATSVIKSIKAAYPKHKLVVVTAYPEVFVHNPNIFRVYKFGNVPYFYEDYIKNKNSIILRMEPYHSGDYIYRKKSLSEIWCNVLGIPFIGVKNELYLTDRELMHVRQKFQIEGPTLLIQSSGGTETSEYSYSWSRDLPPSFAQDIVNSLRNSFAKIYHIRKDKQPVLENTISVTDNFRNLFSLVASVDRILCIDSFVQHAAAALNKRATVGWISTSPKVFGYEIHDNIIANGSESFRHKVDSYLEPEDWTGSKHYECPYNNLGNLFTKNQFIESVLK